MPTFTEAALAEQFCYLETTGRVTGRPHTIEIWFAGDGRTLYLLAGGGERADWVKNLRRNPAVRVRIGETTYVGQAAVIAGEPDELPARQAVATKYYGWRTGPLPNQWARTALPVRIDLAGSA